jgi:hypothetical protein
MRTTGIVIAAVLCAFALPALAQGTTSTPRIDKREADQERRIEQGVKSGQLTEREAARLEKGQARVRKQEEKALADGKLTPQERAKIERAQNRESRKITRAKHDAQRK